jgi:hypothetical protein
MQNITNVGGFSDTESESGHARHHNLEQAEDEYYSDYGSEYNSYYSEEEYRRDQAQRLQPTVSTTFVSVSPFSVVKLTSPWTEGCTIFVLLFL